MAQTTFWRGLLPILPAQKLAHIARGSFGALLGIFACTLLAIIWPASLITKLALVAPLGASAVLVFVVPNSPLAQPWSVFVGNTLSALVALMVIAVVPFPWASAMATAAAIAGMMLARALHPPGGAVALLISLSAGVAPELTQPVALVIVALPTAMLVLTAMVYNRLTGRSYPFRQIEEMAAPERSRLGLSAAELAGLLKKFNQSPNLGAADLGRLVDAAEHEILKHRFEAKTVADIMHPGPSVLDETAQLHETPDLFEHHPLGICVTRRNDQLVGIITPASLSRWLLSGERLRRAGELVVPASLTVTPETPVGALIARMVATHIAFAPVVSDNSLLGVVTRLDIVDLLAHSIETPSTAA